MLGGGSMACGIAYLNDHFQNFWVGEAPGWSAQLLGWSPQLAWLDAGSLRMYETSGWPPWLSKGGSAFWPISCSPTSPMHMSGFRCRAVWAAKPHGMRLKPPS